MSGLAAEYKAINLGQGFPDYPMNPALADEVSRAMQEGYNQYVPMPGYLPLREAVAEKVQRLYDAVIDPAAEITITPGGTYAIYSAATSVIRPGDEVIVFEPAYDSYIPNIEINGGKAVRIPLQMPDFSIDWQAVKSAINPNTRMIMLNSPHNPTGAVLSSDDIQQLIALTSNTDIIIISDEVYEHLIFDGRLHESMLKYQALRERSFVCFSFGKVYDCTGWKLGYCIAPPAFTKEFRKVHQFNCFSVNSPMQVALSRFIKEPKQYLELGVRMQQKRDYLRKLLEATPLRLIPSHGSYFELYSYKGLSDEKETDLAKRMVRACGVATIPVSVFYLDGTDHKLLRFCFCKNENTLEQAVERLMKFKW